MRDGLLEVLDAATILRFGLDDLNRYHGPVAPGGVAHGFVAMLRAWPLLAPDGKFHYRTLSDALASSDIVITEVSAGGSVPELMVVNRGSTAVLLIDGEELAGAKQNRVLNTSILLAARSETRIPVSCTEQGRWSYASPAFAESGNIMAQKVRAMKSRSACSAAAAE